MPAKSPTVKRSRPRVALVVKETNWRTYFLKGKSPRLQKLLSANDVTIARLYAGHVAHERTIAEVHEALATLGAKVDVTLGANQRFRSTGYDLVVTVGGDGTLLRASRSVVDVPVLAVNSAPGYSVGFFCGTQQGDVLPALKRALAGRMKRTVLTRMQVSISGKVIAARVLNDALFCHASPAATSRYILRIGRVKEEQKSSGFWIGPAAGSTAAQRSAGGSVLPLRSENLQLVVREPYTPHGETYSLGCALIGPKQKLVVRNKMHEAKIFVDGPHQVFDARFGDTIEFSRAEDSLVLLGISSNRDWGASR